MWVDDTRARATLVKNCFVDVTVTSLAAADDGCDVNTEASMLDDDVSHFDGCRDADAQRTATGDS